MSAAPANEFLIRRIEFPRVADVLFAVAGTERGMCLQVEMAVAQTARMTAFGANEYGESMPAQSVEFQTSSNRYISIGCVAINVVTLN